MNNNVFVSVIVGVIAPGTPISYRSTTVRYTDIGAPIAALTNALSTPPLLQFLPTPVIPEEELPI